MAYEKFKSVLRTIATELENQWIEKEVYRDLIIAHGLFTPEALKEKTNHALFDPEIRKQTHEDFSGMWKSLEESGTDAWIEDLLKDLPPSGKPN